MTWKIIVERADFSEPNEEQVEKIEGFINELCNNIDCDSTLKCTISYKRQK